MQLLDFSRSGQPPPYSTGNPGAESPKTADVPYSETEKPMLSEADSEAFVRTHLCSNQIKMSTKRLSIELGILRSLKQKNISWSAGLELQELVCVELELAAFMSRSQESCVNTNDLIDDFSCNPLELASLSIANLDDKTTELKILVRSVLTEKKNLERNCADSHALLEAIKSLRERVVSATELRDRYEARSGDSSTRNDRVVSLQDSIRNAAAAAAATMSVLHEERPWRRARFASSAALATLIFHETQSKQTSPQQEKQGSILPELDSTARAIEVYLKLMRHILEAFDILIEEGVLALTLPDYDPESGAGRFLPLREKIEVIQTLLPFISSAFAEYARCAKVA